MDRIQGSTVVITGAARGIGFATATAVLDRGAKVVIGDRDRTALADAVERLRAHGPVTGHGLDVTDRASFAQFLDAARADGGGRIDVLINNAGIFEAASIDLEHGEWVSAWERTMRINLTASAELCRLAVLHFRKQGGGRIVNVASRAAYRGDSPAHWHYAASKAGMIGMTKSIARGFARENILAFAVCPGFVMTGMADDYLASRGGDQLLQDIPLGRVATPGEVASTVRYLALDAPPSMTGAVIDINGASYVR